MNTFTKKVTISLVIIFLEEDFSLNSHLVSEEDWDDSLDYTCPTSFSLFILPANTAPIHRVPQAQHESGISVPDNVSDGHISDLSTGIDSALSINDPQH